MYLPVDTIQIVTLTCCALHNYLSYENSAYLYGATDIENTENHTIIPGEWRNNAQLRNLPIINIRPNRNMPFIFVKNLNNILILLEQLNDKII